MSNYHAHGNIGAPGTDWRFVNNLLEEWDFIGVANLLPLNPGEYSCLIPSLLQLLRAGADAPQLAAHLDRELAGHFGMDGPAHQMRRFAVRLHAAWAQRTM